MSTYDLHSVKLPKLKGGALSAFVAALESPILGAALIGRLRKDAGLSVLSAANFEHAPRSSPLVPSVVADRARRDPPTDLGPLSALEPTGPFESAEQLTEAYASGQTTPEGVARRSIEAARAEKSSLHIFIAQDERDVIAQAQASTARWKNGTQKGPLDGIPIAIKDEMDMVPYPTTVGTRFLARGPATEDATCVHRLREAGAVLLGKVNMHEIGINPNGANPHYGLMRNPYDRSRDTGGSSSASAAAVAAGICPIAVGADGGGSVRIPAALCGVVGLKATFSRVSEHGVAPVCWSVGHIGPLGATVYDVALAYAVMAGPDIADELSLVQPPVTLDALTRKDLTGVRVGVFRPWFEHAQPAIVAAADRALELLVASGAEVVPIELPELDLARVAHAVTILSEMMAAMSGHGDRLVELAPHVRVSLAVARAFTSTDYVRAQRARARVMSHMDRVFEKVDVIATPSTAMTAPLIPVTHDHESWSDLSTTVELMRFAFLQNLTGHPAITVPSGYDSLGLPIGFELTGRHWEEALLLRAAAVVEAGTERRLAPRAARLLA
jgi:Asp-tRNA(Asn)/Glu-tRNA(Gln) amidotransferase A subunit family amidase